MAFNQRMWRRRRRGGARTSSLGIYMYVDYCAEVLCTKRKLASTIRARGHLPDFPFQYSACVYVGAKVPSTRVSVSI